MPHRQDSLMETKQFFGKEHAAGKTCVLVFEPIELPAKLL